MRHIPDIKFGWEMQDVEDPELREALALSMSPLDEVRAAVWTLIEFEDRSATDFTWRLVEVISEFELLCSVVTLVLVH